MESQPGLHSLCLYPAGPSGTEGLKGGAGESSLFSWAPTFQLPTLPPPLHALHHTEPWMPLHLFTYLVM